MTASSSQRELPYSIIFYRWAAHCHGRNRKRCQSCLASSRQAQGDWKAPSNYLSLSLFQSCPNRLILYHFHLWT